MAKNRKTESFSKGMLPLARIAFGFAIIALVCLGYLWQKHQIIRLGNEIKKNEILEEETQRKIDKLKVAIAQLKSPRAIDEKNIAWNLGLVRPHPSQIIHYIEPGKESGGEYAGLVQRTVPNRSVQ